MAKESMKLQALHIGSQKLAGGKSHDEMQNFQLPRGVTSRRHHVASYGKMHFVPAIWMTRRIISLECKGIGRKLLVV